MTKAIIITIALAACITLFMHREQPSDVDAITPQNCSTDLECEQVASYVDFDTEASMEAQ